MPERATHHRCTALHSLPQVVEHPLQQALRDFLESNPELTDILAGQRRFAGRLL
jgi:hypothetical protein